MKFILIRHSKTKPTRDTPIPLWGLTEEGINKADKLSMNPIINEISVMYSSLQTKALETSLLLCKPNKIPMKTNDDLNEISSFTREFFDKEYLSIVKDFYSKKTKRISDGETHEEALKRFETALETISVHEKGKTVGIVSHGNVLAYFSAKYTYEEPLFYHDSITMPDIAVFDWENRKFIKLWEGLND